MKIWCTWTIGLIVLGTLNLLPNIVKCIDNQHGADVDDNEFAEFEEFDDESEEVLHQPVQEDVKLTENEPEPPVDDEFDEGVNSEFDEEDEATIEVEGDDEFATYDPEEFEGLDGDDTIWENERSPKGKKGGKPELKIANLPLHVRSWDKYYLEILMSCGIAVYLINFFVGKYKNNTIASLWFKVHKDFLETQFDLVGDDPQNKSAESMLQLTKECEHVFTLWCSGRLCVEGMLVQMRLLKRQDLVSIIANQMKPGLDQVSLTFTLEDMDPFVLAFGNKKSVMNLQKNMQDIGLYCADKMKSAEKLEFPSMISLSELGGEVVSSVIDVKVRQVIKQNEELFDHLHVSDQYSGPKPLDQDEQQTTQPETSKKLTMVLNFPCKSKATIPSEVEKLLPFLKMALYMVDKLKKLRLSRELKAKADKNRQKVELAYLKLTHAQRQEAAQQKKDDKNKAMKERIMNEEDPDKQRKLEEQQHRKELKKKDKKMMKGKQMKVKPL